MKVLGGTPYDEEIELERDSVTKGIDRYRRLAESAVQRGDGAALQPIERLMAAWFPALVALITSEQKACAKGEPGVGRGVYGNWLIKLSPEQCAVITFHTILGQCLREPEGVSVAQLSMTISGGIMAEWNVKRIRGMKGDAWRNLWRTTRCRLHPTRVNTVASKHIVCGECARRPRCRYAQDPARWPLSVRGHLGAIMLNMALVAAKIPGEHGTATSAFAHMVRPVSKRNRAVGILKLTDNAREMIDAGHAVRQFLRPKYQPMLMKPPVWTATDRGGYVELPVSLIKRTRCGEIPHVIHRSVNCQNSTPWRINKRILAIAESLWNSGGNIADIPPKSRRQKPPLPEDFHTNLKSKRAWKNAASATYRKNAQEESERVNWALKLDIAQRMAKYDNLWYPHQLDFRGRAYAVPLFLNHQGDDVCRGLLEFANGATPSGMGEYWLKIHMANCCGVDKVSFADRITWVEQNEDRFRRWRSDPLAHTDWTNKDIDKPFQALATAYALDDKDAAAHLPIQLDGSNNALQHYAAMMRDGETAPLVNLTQSNAPQDFYGDVAHMAAQIVSADAGHGIRIAHDLEGWVDRALIKQTAMTVFYRVTAIGARRQLRTHLNDAGFVGDRQYEASKYLAEILLKAVAATCPKVHEAMQWLSDCAKVIAETGQKVTWVTPTGLTVTQPYRRTSSIQIETILQRLTLRSGLGDLPIAKRKQIQGFPPNFVHSIDATHLMNTTVRCADAGIDFAGVHDCYWSHAGNIPVLSALIREEFVTLHQNPLLHNLYNQFIVRYAPLGFPKPPALGDLDVGKILQSDYAFC